MMMCLILLFLILHVVTNVVQIFINKASKMNLFEESIESIEKESKINPNKLGWRFLLTSKKTLEKNNGILLLTLNPGGSENRKDHPSDSFENDSAYFVEIWKKGKPAGASPLQIQIKRLFKEIASRLGKDCKEILEASVCGYFIPFRSQSFDSLKEKDTCIRVSKNLWKNILSEIKFQLILSIDRETYDNIKQILLSLKYCEVQSSEQPTGWGNYKASITYFEKGDEKVTFVRFPHLSRFSIFGREKSEEAISKLMDKALHNYR